MYYQLTTSPEVVNFISNLSHLNGRLLLLRRFFLENTGERSENMALRSFGPATLVPSQRAFYPRSGVFMHSINFEVDLVFYLELVEEDIVVCVLDSSF